MKVIIARTAGFCWGVRRAVNMVLEAKQNSSEKVYTYGPLIHNSVVIDDLKSKGIDIYRDNGSTDIEMSCSLVVRAHGIPPEIEENLKSKGFRLINATCPHVVRAQEEVRRYSEKGYSVVIAGDKDHAEIIGLVGYVKTNARVISDIKEIDALDISEPVLFVAQTTFNNDLFQKLKSKLEKKYKSLHVVNTICLATTQRQEELLEIAKKVDALVIVGDKNSANTKRLVSIAGSTNKPVYFIQTAGELNKNEMSGYRVVGVTAGASTPDWLSNKVAEELENI